MKPGQHMVLLTASPAGALRARAMGWVLRDTVVIQAPGPRVVSAYLFRRPLDGTVAETVLRHGEGALAIDRCRVRTGGASQGGSLSSMMAFGQGSGWNRHNNKIVPIDRSMGNGRWPTNLLLVHGEGCKQVGEKRVESQSGGVGTYSRGGNKRHFNQCSATAVTNFKDVEGKETVTAWQCEAGCPVAALDEQTGHLSRAWNKADEVDHKLANKVYSGEWRPERHNPNYHVNEGGGASRFYPQLQGWVEVLNWLGRLVEGA